MPCYHPMIRIENTNKWEKATDGHRYHPATIEQPHDLYNRLEEIKDNISYRYNILPCGKCIGCKLEYSREWANRGYLEAKCWKQNWFVTITYDEDHLTIQEETTDENEITWTNEGDWNGTLVPKELTQFIKNIRQIMKREYKEDGIRFMACGEYGEEGERPHYHIIFFNLNLPPETFYNPKIINKETYWQNTIIERAWGKGIINISEASWNNIAYTARYITKKINGTGSDELYKSKGQEKEFFRVSRMPGIGQPYYEKHKEQIYKNDEIIVKNRQGIISCKPPKYFDELYEKENPEHFKQIKEKRKKEQKNKEKLKDQTYSYGRLHNLQIEERTKEAKNQNLIRTFEAKQR